MASELSHALLTPGRLWKCPPPRLEEGTMRSAVTEEFGGIHREKAKKEPKSIKNTSKDELLLLLPEKL